MAVSQTKMTRSLRIENQLKRANPMQTMRSKKAKEIMSQAVDNKLLYLIIKANKHQHLVNKRKAKGVRQAKSNLLTTLVSKTHQEIPQQ